MSAEPLVDQRHGLQVGGFIVEAVGGVRQLGDLHVRIPDVTSTLQLQRRRRREQCDGQQSVAPFFHCHVAWCREFRIAAVPQAETVDRVPGG